MFIWRRRAGTDWLAANEEPLCDIAGGRLAIIQAPNRKIALVEIVGTNPRELEKIRTRFGGRIERLPRDWLKRAGKQRAKPIKIGNRLTICRSAPGSPRRLIIPRGAAFGTGDHVTTAMSLRFLAQITRKMAAGWSMLDLGTGSGILALAGKRLGAGKVVAIDSDPTAIRVAKQNARRNRVDGIDFRLDDARKVPNADRFTIVTANLFSELLIEVLPKMKGARILILSGILRQQELSVARALQETDFCTLSARRRGKWVALFCRHPRRSRGSASREERLLQMKAARLAEARLQRGKPQEKVI
jgi:ribosomal protein L11 methyltransferase